MNMAEQVIKDCEGATAYSLYAGYAVHPDGSRKFFGDRTTEFIKTRRDGTITVHRIQFQDGSRLEYTKMGQAKLRLLPTQALKPPKRAPDMPEFLRE